MRVFRSSNSLLIVLILACWATASADTPAPASPPDAEFDQQVQIAATHYGQGRYQDAIVALQNAYALQPLPRLLCNIGQAYRKLGNHRAAVAQYELCLKSDPEIDPAYRAEVDSYITERRQQWVARSRQSAAESPPLSPVDRPIDKGTGTQPCPSSAPQTPVYKKWWLWTIVGVLVAGGAIGLGVGLSRRTPSITPVPYVEVQWK